MEVQRPKAPNSEEGSTRIPKRDNWQRMPLDEQLHDLPLRPWVHHLLLRGRASHPWLRLHGGDHWHQDQGQYQQAVPVSGVFWFYLIFFTYIFQGAKDDGNHTRYWETDRSRSTFSILCLPDGTFDFANSSESWPVANTHFVFSVLITCNMYISSS